MGKAPESGGVEHSYVVESKVRQEVNALSSLLFNHTPSNAQILTSTIDEYAPQASMVHFFQKNCACSAYAERHIESLIDEYPHLEHRIITPTSDTIIINGQRISSPLDRDIHKGLSTNLRRTPALLIHSSTSNFAYFGPHSGGYHCGTGQSFAHLTLNNLKNGFNPEMVNINQPSCFCDWAG